MIPSEHDLLWRRIERSPLIKGKKRGSKIPQGFFRRAVFHQHHTAIIQIIGIALFKSNFVPQSGRGFLIPAQRLLSFSQSIRWRMDAWIT